MNMSLIFILALKKIELSYKTKKRLSLLLITLTNKIMKQSVNLVILYNLHLLILSKETGSSEMLAQQLSISRSTLFDIILYMQEELMAPVFYNRQNKTYEYAYTPKFFLSDAICLNLLGAKGSENRRKDESDMHEIDENSETENDLLEASVLNLLYAGGSNNNEDYYGNLSIDNSYKFMLDDDIDFNDLFPDE